MRVLLAALHRTGFRELLLKTKLGQRERERRARNRAMNSLRAAISAGPPYGMRIRDLQRVIRAPVLLTDDEAGALSRYASRAANTVVEIGAAFGGSSTILLGSLSQPARLWSIDPFVSDSMRDWKASREACEAGVARFLRAIGRPQAGERWTLIAEPSYEVVKTWNRDIDMIFIDGDHHYEAVKNDYEDWHPHVKKSGHILIHDSRRIEGTPPQEFALGWPGPTQLAEELKQGSQVKLIEEVASITVWERL